MKKLYKISGGSLLVELTRQDAGLALTRVYDRKKTHLLLQRYQFIANGNSAPY